MPYKSDDDARERSKEYYRKHKDLCLDYNRKWRKEHPEKVTEYITRAKTKQKNRYATDASYRAIIKQKSRERQIKRFHALHEAIIKLIKVKGACEKCGYSDIRALEIHHQFGNSSKNNYYKELKEILDKKVPYSVLCANCHKILHNPRKL